MSLQITENYQYLKREVITHWKTGVVMIGVAVVVGQVYGAAAAGFIVLGTVSNYQIIGQQFRIISWMSLRKTLIAVVMFGNSYYNIISPQAMGYIAVALVLIDNFQLSGINVDLSNQNEILEKNNAKLIETHEGLKKLETQLTGLVKPAAELKVAQEENSAQVEVLIETIPERIQDIPARLQNVNTLLSELLSKPEMQELLTFQADLRRNVNALVETFKTFRNEIEPLTKKVELLSSGLQKTVSSYENNVSLTDVQIVRLDEAIQKFETAAQAVLTRAN